MLLQIAFAKSASFGFLFFSKIMLESWGCGLYTSAAYTQVFTVYVNFILILRDYSNKRLHATVELVYN